MFKLALLTIVSASSITSGATHAFNAAQRGAMQTVGVYAAAANIFNNAGDQNSFNRANSDLYAAGAQLQGWSNYATSQAN